MESITNDPSSSAINNNNNTTSDHGSSGTSNNRGANNTHNDEHEATTAKRRAIQQILSQSSLTERQRSLQIQQLMNGSNPRTILSQLQQEQQNHSLQQLQQMTLSNEIRSDPNGTGGSSSSNHPGMPLGASVISSFAGGTVLPCVHYERKCLMVAPCCGNVYGCRVCHDELTQEEHGPMDRTKVTEIVCKECHTRQPCSNQCINSSCGVTEFAEYHCDKCNLWMGLEKRPFHCEECGICRVGGREQYRHCDVCSMCIHIDTFETHICLKDKYKNQCPVCREDMHTSRHAPQDLPCGHAIHAHCFRKLAGFDYRCPVCKKTVVSQRSMAAAWEARAMDIQSQPMPSDLARNVNIMCYDCEGKSQKLPWHFLGVQCPQCMSFNTVVEEIVNHQS